MNEIIKNSNMTRINAMDGWEHKHTVTQDLHATFGFDFEKRIAIIPFTGKFTLNEMRKTAAGCGYSPADSKLVLLFGIDDSYNDKDVYTARIMRDGFDIDYRPALYTLSWLFRKGDFEDYRKRGIMHGFLICQKQENCCPVVKKKTYVPTANERYRFVENRYKSEAILMRTDGTGKTFEYRTIDASDTSAYLDKSGYLISEARQELHNRVDQYKKGIKKREYLAQDYRERIAALRKLIEAKQETLVQEFAAAKSEKAIDAVSRKLGWSGLSGVYYEIERMEKKDREKDYSSCESFEYDYKGIIRKLTEF